MDSVGLRRAAFAKTGISGICMRPCRLLINVSAAMGLLVILTACGSVPQSTSSTPTATTSADTRDATPTAVNARARDQSSGSGSGGGGLLSFTSHAIWINALIFIAASGIIWFVGTRLENYTDAISSKTGLGQEFAGLLLLATATSLPEIATTTTAAIIGSNAFDVTLLFLAALIAGSVVFQSAPPSALFAAALGIVMTCVYLWGCWSATFGRSGALAGTQQLYWCCTSAA